MKPDDHSSQKSPKLSGLPLENEERQKCLKGAYYAGVRLARENGSPSVALAALRKECGTDPGLTLKGLRGMRDNCPDVHRAYYEAHSRAIEAGLLIPRLPKEICIRPKRGPRHAKAWKKLQALSARMSSMSLVNWPWSSEEKRTRYKALYRLLLTTNTAFQWGQMSGNEKAQLLEPFEDRPDFKVAQMRFHYERATSATVNRASADYLSALKLRWASALCGYVNDFPSHVLAISAHFGAEETGAITEQQRRKYVGALLQATPAAWKPRLLKFAIRQSIPHPDLGVKQGSGNCGRLSLSLNRRHAEYSHLLAKDEFVTQAGSAESAANLLDSTTQMAELNLIEPAEFDRNITLLMRTHPQLFPELS